MPCVLRGLALRGASEPAPAQAGDEEFFLMPSTIFPHAEERSGAAGARLEARTAPDAAHSCPASRRIPPSTETGNCCFVVRRQLSQCYSNKEKKAGGEANGETRGLPGNNNSRAGMRCAFATYASCRSRSANQDFRTLASRPRHRQLAGFASSGRTRSRLREGVGRHAPRISYGPATF
jgi:hypothetical protein